MGSESIRAIRWYMKRREPMSELNKVSIGFFYYDDSYLPSWQSLVEIDEEESQEPFWGYKFNNYYNL